MKMKSDEEANMRILERVEITLSTSCVETIRPEALELMNA
jgi:hypothetical protein